MRGRQHDHARPDCGTRAGPHRKSPALHLDVKPQDGRLPGEHPEVAALPRCLRIVCSRLLRITTTMSGPSTRRRSLRRDVRARADGGGDTTRLPSIDAVEPKGSPVIVIAVGRLRFVGTTHLSPEGIGPSGERLRQLQRNIPIREVEQRHCQAYEIQDEQPVRERLLRTCSVAEDLSLHLDDQLIARRFSPLLGLG